MSNEWKDIPTELLDLNSRVRKALEAADLLTLGQVIEHPDLTTVPGIGKSTKTEILKQIETMRRELGEFDAEMVVDQAGEELDMDLGVEEADNEDDPPVRFEPDHEDEMAELHDYPSGEDLLEKTELEVRREFLANIQHRAEGETAEGLDRMLASAVRKNDYEIKSIINQELDRRHEANRAKQMSVQIEFKYSDLYRDGYGLCATSVKKMLHRHRLSHEAAVALAKLHIAMREGGVRLKSGRLVTSKPRVVQKILEDLYDAMARQET